MKVIGRKQIASLLFAAQTAFTGSVAIAEQTDITAPSAPQTRTEWKLSPQAETPRNDDCVQQGKCTPWRKAEEGEAPKPSRKVIIIKPDFVTGEWPEILLG